MRRFGVMCGTVLVMSLSMAGSAFAEGWIQDPSRPVNENGVSNWWYQREDGSYPAAGWDWIDGNHDGTAESYRFNENGWMYVSTNIDGYDVNDSGAWITNGVVQTKSVGTQTAAQSGSSSSPSSSGDSKKGWVNNSGGKQYINSNGKYETGWTKISGKQYYFDEDGYALIGYENVDGKWYYFDNSGELEKKTCHSTDDGVYYVIDKNDYHVIDAVDEDDWNEYKENMNESSPSSNTDSNTNSNTNNNTNSNTSNNKDSGFDKEILWNDEDEDEEDSSSAGDLTDEEAYSKIIALKSKYPEGKKWDNSNSYKKGNMTGYGCAGFAFMVQDAVFGKNASSTITADFDWDALRVGDHLRIHNSIGGEHSIIVLEVNDDSITICEGNYNSSIHWGRVISMDDLEEVFIYRETCYK